MLAAASFSTHSGGAMRRAALTAVALATTMAASAVGCAGGRHGAVVSPSPSVPTWPTVPTASPTTTSPSPRGPDRPADASPRTTVATASTTTASPSSPQRDKPAGASPRTTAATASTTTAPPSRPGRDRPAGASPRTTPRHPAGTKARTPHGSTAAAAPWPSVFDSWTGGGDDSTCASMGLYEPPEGPYLGDGSSGPVTMPLGYEREICLAGFDKKKPITLTVQRPDGSRSSTTAVVGSDASVGPMDLLGAELPSHIVLLDQVEYVSTTYGRLEPNLAPGPYEVAAEQDAVRVQARLEVRRGKLGRRDSSRLRPVGGDTQGARPGSRIRILLLDFAPRASVALAVYRNAGEHTPVNPGDSDGDDFVYVRKLSSATVNAQGWAYHTITVPPGLPPVARDAMPGYCIVADTRLALPSCQPYVDATFTLAE
jgi:hypothetical protein